MSANDKQVAGDHYRVHGADLQHWDVVQIFKLGYFEGQITKYVMRWKYKNGLQDLKKAAHYLEKLIELEEKTAKPKTSDGPKSGQTFTEYRQESRQTIVMPGASPQTARQRPLSPITRPAPPMPPIKADPPVPKEYDVFSLGQIAPTGWVQFVFEGAQSEGFLYTCRECGNHFNAPPHCNPHRCHPCKAIAINAGPVQPNDGGEPVPHGYVNQNGSGEVKS